MKVKHIIYLAILLSIGLISCSTLNLSIALPTATSTSVPTNTLAPTNIPLPTTTVVSVHDTKLEKRADGTWTYYDNKAGYQFQLGKNWYLEDVSSLNVEEIIERVPKISIELGLKTTPQYFIEPQGMRVLGVYLDETVPDYTSSAFNATHIIDEEFTQMPLEDVQNRIIEMLSSGYKKDSQDFIPKISTNEHGLEFGAVIFNLSLNYLQMKIFFKTHDGIGMITFGFSDKNIDIFGPDWALLTSSLQYINPQ
jgi:hypothetical protein